MHDCRKIEERLFALLVDESGGETSAAEYQQQLAEVGEVAQVKNCARCREQFLTFQAALASFAAATERRLDDEAYWEAYDRRLRARLAKVVTLASAEPPSPWRRFADRLSNSFGNRFGNFAPQPLWAASLAALLLVALLVWGWLQKPANSELPPASAKSSTPQAYPTSKDELPKTAEIAGTGSIPSQQKAAQPAVAPRRRASFTQSANHRLAEAKKERQPQQAPESLPPADASIAVLAAGVMPNATLATLVNEATLRHFEKSQILLRSFRNLVRSPVVEEATGKQREERLALAAEQERSRALVFQNILLRREAEASGNLPVEQMLNDLEPVLLDIANLPANVTAAELRAISARIQRKAIIAALQVYSARPAIASAVTD